jgi:glycosyltransferase involved in cell wall biosynthesis
MIKKVCFVINSLGGGGAERVFSRLVNMLEASDFDVKLIIITLDDEDIKNPINSSIEHIKLNCEGSLIKSLFGLRKLLSVIKPDVVVSFLTRSNVASVFSGFIKPFPVIISERVNTSSHFGNGVSSQLKKVFVRYFYAKANRIVAVSEGVKDDLVRFFDLGQKTINVIGNSYSYSELITKSEAFSIELVPDSFIVCVGRFYKNKNHELLIKSIAEVSDPKMLVLLGDGPEREYLESLVKEYGLEQSVIFKGFIKNPYPYIKHSSGLISASLAEGFPNVIAEALVLGKFVVSSDCQSGPAELLDNRVSDGTDKLLYAKYGILIPVNDKKATSQGLALFNDSALVSSYESKTLSLKDSYSHEHFLARFVDVIKESINEK